MSRRQRIDASAVSAASPEEVWRLLADISTWSQWGPWDESGVEEAAPGGDGVGELRRLRRGRTVSRERVTAFEPGRRLAYTLVSGVPLRDYYAEVLLVPEGGGTRIRWRSSFQGGPLGSGPLMRMAFQAFIGKVVKALAVSAASGVRP